MTIWCSSANVSVCCQHRNCKEECKYGSQWYWLCLLKQAQQDQYMWMGAGRKRLRMTRLRQVLNTMVIMHSWLWRLNVLTIYSILMFLCFHLAIWFLNSCVHTLLCNPSMKWHETFEFYRCLWRFQSRTDPWRMQGRLPPNLPAQFWMKRCTCLLTHHTIFLILPVPMISKKSEKNLHQHSGFQHSALVQGLKFLHEETVDLKIDLDSRRESP